jgi:hypothetical protein
VWEILRPLDLSFLPTVATSVVEDRENPAKVGSVRRVVYKDGTVQLLKLTELHDGTFTLTWDVIMSEPAVSYTSAIHTIRLRRVTASKQTLVEAVSDYSSDSSVAVIQDSRFKKLELFKALRVALAGQPAAPGLQEYVRRANDAEAALRALQRRMDALEKAGDRKGGGGGGGNIMAQYTATFKPDVKVAELVKAIRDFVVTHFSKLPGMRMHSGIVPVGEDRLLMTAYFNSNDAVLAYLQSKERPMFWDLVDIEKNIDKATLKLTVYGPVSAAVKEALKSQNPVYRPTNGF